MYDNLTPRERLAKIVAEETGGGRRIVTFLVQVTEGELHSEGFKPCHRMDSAKELVKIGLTEFEDYIQANSTPPRPRARRTSSPDADISPEIAQAREQLAEYARELTQDGRTVIKMYSEVMEGDRNDEGFKPHHRIAAARELIKRGFDETYTQPEPEPGPAVIPAKAGIQGWGGPAAPEVRPETDSTVVPAKAGTHTPEPTTNESETEEPVDYLAIVKRVVESLDPTEYEDEDDDPDPGYTPDYSMWDMIEYPPLSEISDEHAEIGAALFHEAIERSKAWKRANANNPMPTKEDHPTHDDG